MKLYDFDGMFDAKLSEYVNKNSGKYSEEEWEDVVPALYKKFGDTVIKSLGKTPNEFYSSMSDGEIIKCLKGHLRQSVPVSGFLCSAIEERNAGKLLAPLLDGTREEVLYAMSVIGAEKSVTVKYFGLLVSSDEEEFKNKCAEIIKENADEVSALAIERYKLGEDQGLMLEILSRSTVKSDEIFEVLLNAFRTDPDNVPMHAGYLALYGDERALPYLLDKIDEEGISFVEFTELKYAIDSLGGEYLKERDFSDDPYYKLINPEG